jgi:hypothetical protein
MELLRKNWIIIAIAAYAACMTFASVDNSQLAEHYRIEKERAQRHIKKQIDSVNLVIVEKDKAILQAMKDVQEAKVKAEIAEENALKIKARYDKIRRVTTVDDNQRDSLLSAILSN